MCGIVGAVSTRNIVPILIEGLKRLEYRGYDSCGVAVHQGGGLKRARSTARVAELDAQRGRGRHCTPAPASPTRAGPRTARRRCTTRTRTSPAQAGIALVHNGIIENHDELRAELQARGYVFSSQTDTEVIAHLVDHLYDGDLFDAVQRATLRLTGAYAIAVFCRDEPHRVVGAREGSPLVLGWACGHGRELPRHRRDGAGRRDRPDRLPGRGRRRRPAAGQDLDRRTPGRRPLPAACSARCARCARTAARPSSGPYRHYMQKEIFEQPRAHRRHAGRRGRHHARALRRRRLPRLQGGRPGADPGLRHQLLLGHARRSTGSRPSPASRPAWRSPANTATATACPNPRTLVVTITQSGETADTLAALKHARALGMAHTLTICNVATSAMVRECALRLHHARRRRDRRGLDQGLHDAAGRPVPADAGAGAGARPAERRAGGRAPEGAAPPAGGGAGGAGAGAADHRLGEDFARKENALFLGRGLHYPIALEGALKLKEISYIHAEAYPAGELKHGPLALVTGEMPVVTVAPNDALLEKLKSNMQEVRARGGELFVFADADTHIAQRARRARDPHARALRRADRRSCTWCRCSCWRITRPARAGPTSTSRGTWRRA